MIWKGECSWTGKENPDDVSGHGDFLVGDKKYRLQLRGFASFQAVRDMLDKAVEIGERSVARDVAAELRRLAAKLDERTEGNR